MTIILHFIYLFLNKKIDQLINITRYDMFRLKLKISLF